MRQTSKRLNFTKASIAKIPIPPSGRTIVYDTTIPALGVMTQCTGKKSFFWFRKIAGVPKWITLGFFPDMKVVSARDAATKHNAALGAWRSRGFEGVNPFDADADMTLERLLERYLKARFKDKKPARADYARWMFKRYLKPWRARRLGQVRSGDVRRLHQRMAIDSPVMSNRITQFIRAMFGFAAKAGLWEGMNPGAAVEMEREQSRTRYLDDETHSGEVRRLFKALRKEPSRDLRDYVLLSLFSGARRSDVLSARWDMIKIHERTWRIPTPKGAVPYTVALTDESLAVLKKRKRDFGTSEWVFPSFGKSGHVVDLKGPWKRLLQRAGIENLRQHDLRRSYGARLASMGVPLLAIGRALGHQSTAATEVYARLQTDDLRESVEAATSSIVKSSRRLKS
jgi:integrase